MAQDRVVIVDYVRTAFTKAVPPAIPPSDKAPGKLGDAKPVDMVATLIGALVDRNSITLKPADIERVIVGCVHQEAEQGLNLARLAVLHPASQLPVDVPASSVDMFCASSAMAISTAKNSILGDGLNITIAAGVQSMSKVPMGGFNPMMNPAIYENSAKSYMNMGFTAETLATMYGVTRAEQDAFAVESHRRAAAAQAAGYFDNEIVSFAGVNKDDGIRADSTVESLAKLKTPFKAAGSVTAATSSQVTDGASAVLLSSEAYAAANHLPVKAVILAYAEAGCAPEVMGLGPVEASKKALARAGLKMSDIDVIELNEAFAAQSLAVMKEWDKQGMGVDMAKVNIDGGAIALGHPLGASGARIVGHTAQILERTGKRYGLATMCVGGGQGIAVVIENPHAAPALKI